MTPDELKKLAIECMKTKPICHNPSVFSLTMDELAAYTAAVEAKKDKVVAGYKECIDDSYRDLNELQARIAQLEEALRIARYKDYQGYYKGKHWVAVADKALNESPSTWLSQHDKEVEARVIERLCTAIKAEDDHCADGDYMMDSDDCISVVKGTWERPDWRGLK